MDIQQVAAAVAQDEEGVVVPINGRDDEPYLAADGSPATITVLGSESKKLRQVRDGQFKRLLKHRGKLEAKDIRENRIELAAAAVVSWSGWTANGAPFECTPGNVKALLEHEHILTQVEEGINRHADFFAKSSSS